MQLSDEEKQALKEKYKQQRRAMWAGKRTSDKSSKSVPDDLAHSDVETDGKNHKTQTVNSTFPAETECNTGGTSKLGAMTEHDDDAFLPYESTSQPNPQESKTSDMGSRQLNAFEQNVPEVNGSATETERLVEKIRRQRQEMREEQSSIGMRSQIRRREVEKAERVSLVESKEEGEPAMLTWKLVLGVIGSIIVLIAIGMMLGIWFAKQ